MSLAWAVTAVVLGVVTLARPRLALLLVLATLPLFAHRPSSLWVLCLFSLITTFEVAYLLRVPRKWAGLVRILQQDPLMFLVALYVAASFLSLTSLPLLTLLEKHVKVILALPLAQFPNYVATTLTLFEGAREYSITSAFLTLQAFVFCLIVRRELLRDSKSGAQFALALTAGTATATAVGLLEFFGAMSLVWLRGPDSANFLDDLPIRLQSVTGNPGWYAQYVVLTLPFAAGLLLPGRYLRLRACLFVALLLLIATAVFLSFQRGGWVATFVVMVCLSLTLTSSRRAAKGSRLRRLVSRVSASVAMIAAGVLVVAGLIYGSIQMGMHPVGDSAVRMYSGRVEDIGRASDRSLYVRVALGIGALHPILGAGSESFALRYQQYYLAPDGPYAANPLYPITPTSAHNVYMQTFAGKGAVGLALLLSICATAAWMIARKRATAGVADRETGIALIMGGVSVVGFLVYGVVQEVFYVQVLQLIFFFSLGFISATTTGLVQWRPSVNRTLSAALAGLFLLHLGYEYVYPGQSRLVRVHEPQGLYAQETDEHGTAFRWTTELAVFPVPAGKSAFSIRVRSGASVTQVVKVVVCGVPSGEFPLDDHEWHTLRFLLPRAETRSRAPLVELQVVPPLAPAADGRVRGVMVNNPEFE